MQSNRVWWAAVPALLLAGPALAVQSSAYAVSASLTVDGTRVVQLVPQLATSGSTTLGQTYDAPLSAALLSKTVVLTPTLLRGAALAVTEQKLATEASGVSGVDAFNGLGTSAAASGLLRVQPTGVIVPLDPTTASASLVTLPALQVEFSKLKTSASYSVIVPQPSRRSGAASVASLTLSGSWIGTRSLSFKGDLAPNTVVLDTPTIKVTLDAQFIPQQVVCTPGTICPDFVVLDGVETQAVRIELHEAKVGGHTVSGEIVIGEARASQ